MKNQYEYTINSTEDIRRALADAERNGYDLTHYNSAFYLRGTASEPISVDDSLANLHVTAYGPAPVWVSGEAGLRAKGSVAVYAAENSYVEALDSSTVYAYGNAVVVARDDSTVYAESDTVTITATGKAKVYLPRKGLLGAEASIDALEDSATLIKA